MRFVDEDGRTAVADARRVRDEAEDGTAAARLDVGKAKAELEIARQERKVAVARLQRAETDNGAIVRTEDGTQRIGTDRKVAPAVREAQLGIACADDRISWRKCSVEAEERHVNVLEARRALADATVQQVKGVALMRADRPEVDANTIEDLDRTVRRLELEITIADTRLAAAQKEVELAKVRADTSIETRRQADITAADKAASARAAESEREAATARKSKD